MTTTATDNLITTELAKLGFQDIANETPAYRIVCSATAKEKTGKTYFAMTAPPPIGAISTDTGTEEIAKLFMKKKRIVISHFKSVDDLRHEGGDSEKAKGRALTEWTRMKDAAYAIIDNLKFRTLIFDTGTEAWELCRMARFGKLAQVMPQHYTEVNSEFRALVKAAYERKDLNVFFLHKVKKEYRTGSGGKDAWNGKWERSGFGDMPYLVDVNLENYFNSETKEFGVRVVDSRINMINAVGMELEGSLCTFSMLAETLFPETIGTKIWE